MSSETSTPTRDLADFAELLRELESAGIELVVIGGCAVGAYARLLGERVFSDDLDIYVSEQTLREVKAWAEFAGATIEETPRPRALPVLVLRWKGQELNALTQTVGLPEPDIALRAGRDFELAREGLTVSLVDPYDLLRNKLATHREKDRPHIEILIRYLEAEVQQTFGSSGSPRERIAPVRRYLAARNLTRLPDDLAQRLIAGANDPVVRRYLIAVVESNLVQGLLERAETSAERDVLETIRRSVAGADQT